MRWLLLFMISSLYAARNPFVLQEHSYFCSAVGIVIPCNKSFAKIAIDGVSYQVHVGDLIAEHKIISIEEKGVTCIDATGRKQEIML